MKTRTKLGQVIGLLGITPLLMGNAPRPYPVKERYTDFEVSYVELAQTSDSKSVYEFTISNTGNEYISTEIGFSYREKGRTIYLSDYTNSSFFGIEILIAPNSSYTFSSLLDEVGYDFSNKDCFDVYSYKAAEGVTVQGNKGISLFTENDYKNEYLIDAKLENVDPNKNYFAGVTISYEGNTYSAMCFTNQNKQVWFYAEKSFDPSKAVVQEIIPMDYPIYKGGYNVINDIFIGLIIICLLFISLTLIAPAIVLPIVFTSRKKRREKINTSNN